MKDNMEAFLCRLGWLVGFEIYANSQGWNREQWEALLSGKALEVFSRLSFKDTQDYEILKDALLKRFNLTEE